MFNIKLKIKNKNMVKEFRKITNKLNVYTDEEIMKFVFLFKKDADLRYEYYSTENDIFKDKGSIVNFNHDKFIKSIKNILIPVNT